MVEAAVEEWRDIVGWEGVYQVSRCGLVRRVAVRQGIRSGQIMSGHVNDRGYVTLRLSWDGESKYRTVHSLVCEAFIGARPAGKVINHIDGNKQNNSVANLEYVTQYENYLHSIRTGLRTEKVPKITAEQARAIRSLNGVKHYQQVAAEFGISARSVRDIWSGRNWKYA